MGEYSSYYLYQRYEKRGSHGWIPSYPTYYSVDADGTLSPVVRNENDTECGYSPGGDAQYRWVDAGESVCDDCPEIVNRQRVGESNIFMEEDDEAFVEFRKLVKYVDYGDYDGKAYPLQTDGSTGRVVESPYRYSGQCLTFKVNGSECIRFGFMGDPVNFEQKFADGEHLMYSLDSGSTWTVLPDSGRTPYICSGQTVMWKGNLTNKVSNPDTANQRNEGIGRFISEFQTYSSRLGDNYSVLGNVMSLKYEDDYDTLERTLSGDPRFSYLFAPAYLGEGQPSTVPLVGNAEKLLLGTLDLRPYGYDYSYCYSGMFSLNYKLTNHPQLLPARNTTDYCYADMFLSCAYMTEYPLMLNCEGKMSRGCYAGMFENTGLVFAPYLPSMELGYDCYKHMFAGCRNLRYPMSHLPAKKLADGCYDEMFNGCFSLEDPPVICAETIYPYSMKGMFLSTSLRNVRFTVKEPTFIYNLQWIWYYFGSSFISTSNEGDLMAPGTWVNRLKEVVPDNWKIIYTI